MKQRRSTATSNFGAGAREGHDASAFYARFLPPEVSDADDVLPPKPIEEPFVCGDSRHMDTIDDGSVALVVTSPPYFAGKQYEEELGRDGVPASYLEYLELLRDVFAECARKLEPGGRVAVNVANLGRKPYRSLSADVTRILQDDLGLLLRGEVIWQKAEGASGSCAWGSFRGATNPVLRDITERVVIASKGRFDRARTVKKREAEGLPFESTLSTDDFMALTLDVWSIPPESAQRVGHPAPFPVELPEQLIRLFTFADDLVLDPFMGSGSALVAAARLGRRYVGYDLDPAYVEIARGRVEAEDARLADEQVLDTFPLRAAPDGRAAQKIAEDVITESGFEMVERAKRVRKTGVSVGFIARDTTGAEWFFDVGGPATANRGGMKKTDAVWRALGRAVALRGRCPEIPVVVLTTDLPKGDGEAALRAAGPLVVFDVIDLWSGADRERLAGYAKSGPARLPELGFWRPKDFERPAWRP